MTTLPTACVIGAGSSGIAAAKIAARARARRRGAGEVRPCRRQLGVRQPQRDVVVLPLAPHQHLARADGVLGFPDAEVVSRLPPPHPDRGLLRRLRRPLRRPRSHPVRDRRRACPPQRGRGVGDHHRGRREPPLRHAARGQRPPLGPALARAGLSGQFRRGAGPRPLLRRQRAVPGQERARRGDRQQRDGHRRRVELHRPADVHLLAPRRVHPAQVPVRPPARPDRSRRDGRAGSRSPTAATCSRRCSASGSAR